MENKKLRRESIARATHDPSPIDETDGDDFELDELRKTVQGKFSTIYQEILEVEYFKKIAGIRQLF